MWTFVIEHPDKGAIEERYTEEQAARMLVDRGLASGVLQANSLMAEAVEVQQGIEIKETPRYHGGTLMPPDLD